MHSCNMQKVHAGSTREGLQKLNIDLGILNAYVENLIFHLIGSENLNVVLQIFSVLHSNVL